MKLQGALFWSIILGILTLNPWVTIALLAVWAYSPARNKK